MTKSIRVVLALLALLLFAEITSAQDVVGWNGIKVGVGSFFAEETQTFSVNQMFFAVQYEGLTLPFRETATGAALELGWRSLRGNGLSYALYSRNRTKIAGPTYGGMDFKLTSGAPGDQWRADIDMRLVIGVHLGKVWSGVLDVEFYALEETSAGTQLQPSSAQPISFAILFRPGG